MGRILYYIPLISLSESQYEQLEALHRKRLRIAFGVPQGASKEKVIRESQSATLRLMAPQALLRQVIRLG